MAEGLKANGRRARDELCNRHYPIFRVARHRMPGAAPDVSREQNKASQA